MGWSSAVAFPRRSALTILRSASFRIRRPIAIPCPRPVDLLASPSVRRRRRRPSALSIN
jgi:hypothetical protein